MPPPQLINTIETESLEWIRHEACERIPFVPLGLHVLTLKEEMALTTADPAKDNRSSCKELHPDNAKPGSFPTENAIKADIYIYIFTYLCIQRH